MTDRLGRLLIVDDVVPVIRVTASEDAEVARQLLRVGAFDYVAKPFDFAYLDRAVAAGLVHAGQLPTSAPPPPAVDVWQGLACAAFRAVRRMAPAGPGSTGERLESLALGVARDAGAGRVPAAAAHLRELCLLVSVAAELGDRSPAERSGAEAALQDAGKALPA